MSVVSLARNAGSMALLAAPALCRSSRFEAETSMYVEQVLADQRVHLLQNSAKGAKARDAAVRAAHRRRCCFRDRVGHVAVSGVGDDEIALAVIAGSDAGELVVHAKVIGRSLVLVSRGVGAGDDRQGRCSKENKVSPMRVVGWSRPWALLIGKQEEPAAASKPGEDRLVLRLAVHAAWCRR